MKNYYQILGLKEDATAEEIKKAFRLYAQKFHPDKHKGDKFFEDRFKEIKEAHDTLLQRLSRNDAHQPEPNTNNQRETSSKPEAPEPEKNNYHEPKKESFLLKTYLAIGWILPFFGGAMFADTSATAGIVAFVFLFVVYLAVIYS